MSNANNHSSSSSSSTIPSIQKSLSCLATSLSNIIRFKSGSAKNSASSFSSINTGKNSKEKKRLLLLRICVLLCLAISAVSVGYGSYRVLSKLQASAQKEQYFALARKIESSTISAIDNKHDALLMTAQSSLYFCPNATMWPNCAIPFQLFDTTALPMHRIATMRSISTAVLVTPTQAPSFESFVASYYQASGFTTVGQKGITAVNATNGKRYHDTTGHSGNGEYELLVPVFQIGDLANNAAAVLFNLYSETKRVRCIDFALNCVNSSDWNGVNDTKKVAEACTSITGVVFLVQDRPKFRPASLTMYPIIPKNSTEAVAVVSAVHNWDTVLNLAANDRVSGITAVLSTTYTKSDGSLVEEDYTFEYSDGVANYIDSGDLHDDRFDNQKYSFQATSFAGSVVYSVALYPTQQWIDIYEDNIPTVACGVAVGLVVFTSLVFFLYDQLIHREALEKDLVLQTKRQFVRYISHEIRTPLNVVQLGFQVLCTDMMKFQQFLASMQQKESNETTSLVSASGATPSQPSSVTISRTVSNQAVSSAVSKPSILPSTTGGVPTIMEHCSHSDSTEGSANASANNSLRKVETTSMTSTALSVVPQMTKKNEEIHNAGEERVDIRRDTPFGSIREQELAADGKTDEINAVLTTSRVTGSALRPPSILDPIHLSTQSQHQLQIGAGQPWYAEEEVNDRIQAQYKNQLFDWLSLIDDIVESAEAAIGVLNDLINYDKLDSGTLAIQREILSVWDLIASTVQPFSVQAKHKHIELVVHLEDRCPELRGIMMSAVLNGNDDILLPIEETNSTHSNNSTSSTSPRRKLNQIAPLTPLSTMPIGSHAAETSQSNPSVSITSRLGFNLPFIGVNRCTATAHAQSTASGVSAKSASIMSKATTSEVDVEMGRSNHSHGSGLNLLSAGSDSSRSTHSIGSRGFVASNSATAPRKEADLHQHGWILEHQLLFGDKPKLSQVIRNLVSNALKFTPEYGKVTIVGHWNPRGLPEAFEKLKHHLAQQAAGKGTAAMDNNGNEEIKIENYVSKGSVVLTVTDSGAGMSAENLARLFQEGVQFNPNKLQAGQGSGLGLWISKGIVAFHHGKLSATSAGEGQGSTFTLELPLVVLKNLPKPSITMSSSQIVNNMGLTGKGKELLMMPSYQNIPVDGMVSTPTGDDDNSVSTAGPGTVLVKLRSNSAIADESTITSAIAAAISTNSMQGSKYPHLYPHNTVAPAPMQTALNRKERSSSESETHSQSSSNGQVSVNKGGTSSNGSATHGGPGLRPEHLLPSKFGEIELLSESGLSTRYPNILVTDDAPTNRKMICRSLQAIGFHCMQAVDGVDCVEKVKQSMTMPGAIPIHLILMDYEMPRMDGPTASSVLRSLQCNVPIIGITGNVLSEDTEFFLKHGATRVIHKPFTVQALEKVLREISSAPSQPMTTSSAVQNDKILKGHKELMVAAPSKT